MLTYNINTSDGLVNGAMGVVVNIIEKLKTVTTILVQFDNDVVGLQAKMNILMLCLFVDMKQNLVLEKERQQK